MIKTLISKIGDYKKETILTPLFMVGEVLMETLIPTVMAMLIDEMTGESLSPVFRYGSFLLILACFSLFFGAMSARFGAKASTGFAKNLRKAMFDNIMQNRKFTVVRDDSAEIAVLPQTFYDGSIMVTYSKK